MNKQTLETELATAREQIGLLEGKLSIEQAHAGHYRYVVEHSPDLIQSVRADGSFAFVNQAWLDRLGYSAQEVKSLRLTDVIHPAHRDACQQAFAAIQAGADIPLIETEFKTKGGETVEVQGTASARRLDAGEFVATYSILRDVTYSNRHIRQRAEAEASARLAQEELNEQARRHAHELEERVEQRTRELRESEAYARLLFDASPDPISVATLDGTMVDINQAFIQQHGLALEAVRGRNVHDLLIFSAADLERSDAYMAHVLAGEAPPAIEMPYTSPDGSPHTLELHSYRITTGHRHLILSTSRDITLHKQAAETLRMANAEMEHALRLKDAFLANMSHELRTPLNTILGVSESLAEQVVGALTKKQVGYARLIHESGQHLLSLINDILDLSKIEAGHMSLELDDAAVESLCQAGLRMVKELAHRKRLRLSFEMDERVRSLRVDARRLKQVLVNLLGNAVKFTPEGGQVGLQVRALPESAQATFTVWDTGIGIAPEDLPRLFQPFVQLDAGLAREHAGTGLGLALVAQMVRLHGGSVSVESRPGEGSRFTVTLPWEPAKNLTGTPT